MKFSLFYPVATGSPEQRLGTGLLGLDSALYHRTLAELTDQAVAADETGWTSLLLAEHHFEVEGYQVTPNPLLLNVHLAAQTQKLRHGQMGLVLPNWNPLRLAEDIAVADHLTGGRLDIGLSRGYQSRSVGVIGQHVNVSVAGSGDDTVETRNRRVFEEWFEVMRRAWTEDLWSYEGEFIQVPPKGLAWPHPVSDRLGAGVADGELQRIAVVPKPLQHPHPPLFTTLTQSPATIEWAARNGSSIVTLASDPTALRGIFQSYKDISGREGGVALCRMLSVAQTREEAWKTAEQSMAFMGDWLGEFGFFEAWRLPGQQGPVPRTLDQLVESGMMLVGTPDDVGEQVQRLKDDLGVEHIIFVACAGAVDHQRMLDTITLFGENVIRSPVS
jgi:alkanesulfonate monooxygenase SsuD/methylene tetrahydromethanopterin reductase-like flavin-dependent oxidoreductase (luciferase family)